LHTMERNMHHKTEVLALYQHIMI